MIRLKLSHIHNQGVMCSYNSAGLFRLKGTWSLPANRAPLENASESLFSFPGQTRLGAQQALPLVTQEAGCSAPATAESTGPTVVSPCCQAELPLGFIDTSLPTATSHSSSGPAWDSPLGDCPTEKHDLSPLA